MNADQLRALLARRCAEAGSQKAWARGAGVSQPYVNDVLKGKREPGESIAKALGFERIVIYRKIQP